MGLEWGWWRRSLTIVEYPTQQYSFDLPYSLCLQSLLKAYASPIFAIAIPFITTKITETACPTLLRKPCVELVILLLTADATTHCKQTSLASRAIAGYLI